ncbi:alanine racemase [Polynucleobacter sp. AP-Titi-500A-B4]|uniref:alanine racemase n=1 Tax=Polynucleobacter sp. AP-Titi-500A-B4 TaxID=2576923 RepID=UPI001BFD0D47|nr:alanine racemase [Polynucleobacter sp. AP-Titi-500A-B4]QWE13557.1 alanine racemase [Polynucleobacter sp. AP-Titi-500A-B4]
MNRPILASIHTQAFQHNLNRVRELAPESKIWSVIKARAYGHTFDAVLKGLESTDGFALLDIQDAVCLREHGWQGRILLLEGLFHENEIDLAQELHCDLVVHCETQIEWLERYADKVHKPISVFLKMNTGMNRLGLKPEAYRTAFHRLHSAGYRLHHMTHFANADQMDRKPTVDAQQELFNQTIEGLDGPTSLANSAAILWHRNALGDWVRPGIMLYGASPTGLYADIEHAHLQAVMQLHSEIIDIQELQAGDRIGYGGRYEAPEPMRVGIVACGYADGYPRHAKDGTPVWVGDSDKVGSGIICPLVGRVSMDMLTVDLRNAPHAKIGSVVELWGDKVPVDQVAQMSNTIGYELLCAVAPRVPVKII